MLYTAFCADEVFTRAERETEIFVLRDISALTKELEVTLLEFINYKGVSCQVNVLVVLISGGKLPVLVD